MSKNSSLILSLLAAVSLTSCSTIVNGRYQSVGIASNPSDATVWIDNAYIGQTPLIVDMSRQSDHYVRIELNGFQPYELIFTKKMNAWVFGNIIFGGLIGIVVDVATGAIYKLTPDQVQAELCSHQIVKSKRSQDSYIAIVLQADPTWQKIGSLVANK
jgi:hypothetical protein